MSLTFGSTFCVCAMLWAALRASPTIPQQQPIGAGWTSTIFKTTCFNQLWLLSCTVLQVQQVVDDDTSVWLLLGTKAAVGKGCLTKANQFLGPLTFRGLQTSPAYSVEMGRAAWCRHSQPKSLPMWAACCPLHKHPLTCWDRPLEKTN